MEKDFVRDPYDEIQHDPVSEPPTDLSGLPIDEIIEVVSDWFLENFEDPAYHTPYDSREGGYQYIWGGPYDTREILEHFLAGELDDDQLDEVAEALDTESPSWVPSHSRLQAPEEEEERPEPPASTSQLHERMLTLIAEAEEKLKALEPEQEKPAHGIGHNQPPEPLEDAPVTQKKLLELRAALATLKSQPIKPDEAGQNASSDANATVASVGQQLASWCSDRASDFFTEAVKEAGKETGKWVTRLTIWSTLSTTLISLSKTVLSWLHTLNLPF